MTTRTQLAATIRWPEQPDRGIETYAPFISEQQRMEWVEACEDAADNGWSPLQGAEYTLHMIHPPFDPSKFNQKTGQKR